METRRLGKTDLYPSVIGFGCWIAGGSDYWAGTTETEIIDTIRKAYDMGITFFDVAPVYGYGNAEKLLGKAVKGIRDKVIIATKCGLVWKEVRHEDFCLEKKSVLREIDASLQRLDMDHVDLYQLHWPDYNTDIDETFDAINEIKKTGKVRYVGLSNFPVGLAKQALKHSNIASEQLLYNMLDRNSSHYHGIPLHYKTQEKMVPFCRENKVSIIPYSPLSQGLLSGKYRVKEIEQAGKNDMRYFNPELHGEALQRRLAVVEKLKAIADDIGRPLSELALNWLLAEPAVATIVCGARNERQIAENAQASSWKLDGETLARVNGVLDESGF